MWFIKDPCGIFCCIFTYFIVLTVAFGFVRIGIYEDLMMANPIAFIHLAIFTLNCAGIFASHFKAVTTEPGCLPQDYEDLD